MGFGEITQINPIEIVAIISFVSMAGIYSTT